MKPPRKNVISFWIGERFLVKQETNELPFRHKNKQNKLLNKLSQILLCTIWIDKGNFWLPCVITARPRRGDWNNHEVVFKPRSGLSFWYQSNRTLGSIGKPVTGYLYSDTKRQENGALTFQRMRKKYGWRTETPWQIMGMAQAKQVGCQPQENGILHTTKLLLLDTPHWLLQIEASSTHNIMVLFIFTRWFHWYPIPAIVHVTPSRGGTGKKNY